MYDEEEFREMLQELTDRALLHYLQRYACQAMSEVDNPKAACHNQLDLLYAECLRRGKERLYDMAYEMICRHPKVCQTLGV